ncbi:MAG: hypothetical protein AAGB31_05280 [Bdellovibrio sp.]
MTPEKLDFIFPFFVFFYGLLMVLVLENPVLVRLGQEKLGGLFQQVMRHKALGWLCFFVGGLWSAQNVWYSSL